MSKKIEKIGLGSCCTSIKDGTHGTHPRVLKGIPLLSAKNITSFGEVVFDESDQKISRQEYKSIIKFFPLKKDDVLLTVVGSLGRSAIFKGEEVAFQRSVAFLRPDDNVVYPRFLYHAIRHEAFQRQLLRRSNATAQAGIYLGELAHCLIPDIEKKEQNLIANILDILDTQIRQTEAIIAKLQQVKQGLLHDLLTRGIDENGQLRPPYEQAPELYKASPLGWTPKKWKIYNFGEVARYTNGFSFSASQWKEDGLPIIRIQNLNGAVSFNYYQGAIKEEWFVRPGDLLFAWSGQRGVSFGARVWNGPEGVLNQHIFKVQPNEDLVTKKFLLEAFRVRQSAIEESAHGFKDSFLHVTRGELTSVLSGVPSLVEQSRICVVVSMEEEKIVQNKNLLEKLKKQKAGLMDDLLTGRVRVTELIDQQQAS